MNTFLSNTFTILFAFAISFSFVQCDSPTETDAQKAALNNITASNTNTADKAPATTVAAKDPANAVKPKPAVTAPTGPTTTMNFDETSFDFGTISQGESATHVYKFKNTGNEPLLISKAKGSCGCTVPKWPKDAIAPGAEGEINVVFNSKGKKGKQSKRVTITANTNPAQTFLNISGNVAVKTPAKTPKVGGK